MTVINLFEVDQQKKSDDYTPDDLKQHFNRFAYAVSHDLGTPLRHIKGFTELFERSTHDTLDPRATHYLQNMKQATDKLDDMMKGVLRYSRVATRGQPPRPVDSKQLITEVVNDFLNNTRPTPFIAHTNMPILDADPQQLRTVFSELISNSVIYAQPGQPANVHITCNRMKNNWLFTVADNGIGISDRDHPRIFEIFYRGVLEKDYPKGNGVGLALCEKIIHRHGGTIWHEPGEKQGTHIHFTWPIFEWREKH